MLSFDTLCLHQTLPSQLKEQGLLCGGGGGSFSCCPSTLCAFIRRCRHS